MSKILVVDDDVSVRSTFKTILESFKHEVIYTEQYIVKPCGPAQLRSAVDRVLATRKSASPLPGLFSA